MVRREEKKDVAGTGEFNLFSSKFTLQKVIAHILASPLPQSLGVTIVCDFQ